MALFCIHSFNNCLTTLMNMQAFHSALQGPRPAGSSWLSGQISSLSSLPSQCLLQRPMVLTSPTG